MKIDWLVVSSVAQVLSLVFLIIYVIKTWEMASATRKAAEATEKSVVEMQEARDQETAPRIVLFFDLLAGSDLIYLVIKNVGKGVARDVMVSIDPPLQSDIGKGNFVPMNIGFIKDGVSIMPPDYEIRALFATVRYLNSPGNPMKFVAHISFYGGIKSDARTSDWTLDLSAFDGIRWLNQKNMTDLVNQVEHLVTEIRGLRGQPRGM